MQSCGEGEHCGDEDLVVKLAVVNKQETIFQRMANRVDPGVDDGLPAERCAFFPAKHKNMGL